MLARVESKGKRDAASHQVVVIRRSAADRGVLGSLPSAVQSKETVVVRTDSRQRGNVESPRTVGEYGIENIQMHFRGAVLEQAHVERREGSVVLDPAIQPGSVIPGTQVSCQPVPELRFDIYAVMPCFGIEHVLESATGAKPGREEESAVVRRTGYGPD